MSGFQVQIEALRGYGKNLTEFQSQADEFVDLVGRADVGDEAWGLVGLATKSSYTEALNELSGLLDAMKEGLSATSEKINRAAEIYESNDREGSVLLGQHEVQIDKVSEAAPNH